MSEHRFSTHPRAARPRLARLTIALAGLLFVAFSVVASRDPALAPVWTVTGVATGDDKTTSQAVAKANAFWRRSTPSSAEGAASLRQRQETVVVQLAGDDGAAQRPARSAN